jgi:DNA-binding transcriptional ArsR family regulator
MSGPIGHDFCATKLGALAAPERIKIVRFLRDGARDVTEIAAMLGTAPVNVCHHAKVLREAGLVESRKEGRPWLSHPSRLSGDCWRQDGAARIDGVEGRWRGGGRVTAAPAGALATGERNMRVKTNVKAGLKIKRSD